MTLEEMYRSGVRTPNASQIQQITARLSYYGRIEGKNVFYWFQNHKARERQKLRRRLCSHYQLLYSANSLTHHQFYCSQEAPVFPLPLHHATPSPLVHQVSNSSPLVSIVRLSALLPFCDHSRMQTRSARRRPATPKKHRRRAMQPSGMNGWRWRMQPGRCLHAVGLSGLSISSRPRAPASRMSAVPPPSPHALQQPTKWRTHPCISRSLSRTALHSAAAH
ncbi:hypothetical protein B296_00024393 [Ensete ventricosum]|uniref:Homeobox domain-containing protein n=1 Tax=Ensete ventricosum TaxID=4639 RepID=A0A427AV25_ENSVE|nr:hypothetical protein B296_00024393 [Ensete ventricosum]